LRGEDEDVGIFVYHDNILHNHSSDKLSGKKKRTKASDIDRRMGNTREQKGKRAGGQQGWAGKKERTKGKRGGGQRDWARQKGEEDKRARGQGG
jgi:hypothetical protein